MSGETILDRLKDRVFSVPVEFDGEEGFARIANTHTNLIKRRKEYKVSVIFDGQEYEMGYDDPFIYTVKGSR